MLEKRVYLIPKRLKGLSVETIHLSMEEFKTMAEEQGLIYSTDGFTQEIVYGDVDLSEYDINVFEEFNHDVQISEESARITLKNKGYFVDNLWHIEDVLNVYPTATKEQAMEILDKALTNEATGEQIQFSIEEFGDFLYELTPRENEED